MKSFSEYLKNVKVLPGRKAHLELAPRIKNKPIVERFKEPPENHRKAATSIIINEQDKEPYILLVLRKGSLKYHPYEWGFPGGANEQGETLLQTALRELKEETNINEDHLKLIKPVSELYIPVSNFKVKPYSFVIKEIPNITISPDELVAYKWINLKKLLQAPKTVKTVKRKIFGNTYEINFPAWEIDKNYPPLWGATAMMTNELLHIYKQFLQK